MQGVDNVVIFDPFNALCPPADAVCRPYRGELASFTDRIHLSLDGASALTDPFISLLKSKGWLPQASSEISKSNLDLNFQQKSLPFIAPLHLGSAENLGRWTDGTPLVLKSARWLPPHFRMTLDLGGAYAGTSGKTVNVRVAEQARSFVASASPGEIVLDFDYVPVGTDTIIIDIPDPISPEKYEGAQDQRKLGLFLSGIHISAMDIPKK